MPDTVGNTPLTARRVFPIASSQTITEFIGVENGVLDPADYFTFTLARSSSVTVSLNGLSANANVELLDRFGAVVTDTDGVGLSSTNTGTLAESVNTILSAGVYYIRVFPGPSTNPSDPLGSTPSTNYSLNVAANANIQTDIAWRNYTSGQNAIWVMNGTSIASADFPTSVGNLNWRLQATGDFNRDNNTDLVWRNSATGQNAIWLMSSNTLNSAVFVEPVVNNLNWQIQGAGDFNNDGSVDLVWRNFSTGQNAVWFMNGVSFASVEFLPSEPNLNIQIQGIADFNNDGFADIVLRDYTTPPNPASANNLIWFMNGTTRVNTALLPRWDDLNYRIQGTGDFNNDGRPDILWRNVSTGENRVWLMNGALIAATATLPTVGVPTGSEGWQAVAPYNRFLAPVRADIAGATTSTPFSIGPLNGSGTYFDAITTGDTNDYYQFSLGSDTSLSIALTGVDGGNLLGDLDLQVFNAFGSIPVISGVALESVNGGNGAETIATPPGFSLGAGTYYVRVFPKPGETSTYRLAFSANNLPILVSRNNLTLNEGSQATISNNLLLVTDENNPPSQLTYTLVTPPNLADGTLSLNSASITTGSTFTQADINAGRLSYRQSGSETLTDNFVFAVTDGIGGNIGNTSFTINVIPVNDAPVLVSNGALTVTEGAAIGFTTLNLLATDVEQPASQLVYSLTSLVTNGTLVLNSNPLTLGASFTQADIDTARLRYSHNGSETLNDGFSFALSDGAGGTLNPAVTSFSINVTPFDDPPVLVTNRSLTVNQDESRAITSTLLTSTDAEFINLPDQVLYTIAAAPTRGTLFRDATALTTGSIFSQADLNAGVIFYDHDGSNTNSDSFSFRIGDGNSVVPGTTLQPAVFNIIVNRSNFPPVLATNAGLAVSEGATALITPTQLRVTDLDNAPPQLVYTLQSLPVNGRLTRFGAPLTIGQTFTQADIDTLPNSRIAYVHNGSETLSDSFSFTASDGSSSVIPTSTFSIAVTPVNDAPVLVSNRGATLAEGDAFLITNGILSITDNDSPPPSSLVYSLTSVPTNGTLFLGTTAVTSFTQADVNSGLLRYQHNGSESVSDSFIFSITDGAITTPIGGNVFNIAVTPVNDPPRVSLNTGLTLSEGASTTIGSLALLVTDPDGPSPVSYTLGTTPGRGTLLLGTTTLSTGQTFTQSDINSGRLSYLHDGSETTSDSFVFTASDGSTGVLGSTSFNINVIPVNDPPALTIPGAQAVDEDSQLILTDATRISVSDAENDNPITVNLSASNGSITVSGVGVPGNGTNSVTITGTVSAVNIALASVIYQPIANFNGADAIVLTAADAGAPISRTIDVTVRPVNDPPTLTLSTTAQPIEDTPLALTVTTTDIDSGNSLVRATATATNGTLSIGGGAGLTSLNLVGTITDIQTALATLTYRGNPDYFGPDTITVTVNDQGATGSPGAQSVTQTLALNVQPVNDAPSFTGGPSQTVNEDIGRQVLANWATNISRGPANEANQSLSFLVVSNSNPDLFTTAGQPTIDPSNGTLSYTPADNAFGSATVAVRLQDNGGTALGGVDVSSFYTFTVNVLSVNDAPTFTAGPNITVTEDSPAQSVLWATNIIPGPGTPLPPNEANQTVNFLVSNDNPSLFTTGGQPTIAPNGTLNYTLAQDANGISVVTVRLRDNGGIDNGGIDTSAPVTFTINALAVNDPPTLTLPGTQTVDEDNTINISGIRISDVDAGSGNLRVTLNALGPNGVASGGNLNFNSTSGVTITGNSSNSVTLTGTLANLNQALASLAYQGRQDVNGTERIVINVNDQGNTGIGGPLNTPQTLTVNINAVNDAPILNISGGTTRTVAEDTLLTLGGLNITDVDSDTGNLLVTVSALQGVLAASASGGATIGGTGNNLTITGTRSDINATLANLRYQGNLNYFGADTVTVAVNDQGNTGIGGPQTDTRSLSINVTPVNDLPTLTLPTPLAVNEDTNLPFTGVTAIALTDVDSGSNPVRITLSVNNGTLNLSNAGLSTITGANGTRTATYEGTINDIIAALSTLVYRGNSNYNGSDRLTITVNDNGFTGATTGTPVIGTADITVNPVNDPPVLVTNNALILNENANQVISNGLLRVTDADNPALNTLVYTIQAGGAPANGLLVRNGTTLGVGGTFTQADINGGLLRYFHNGSETTSDSFAFQVTDGSDTLTNIFQIVVNPINDVPVLVNRTALTVTEGSFGTIGTTQLLVTDPDNTASQLRYTITNLPNSGSVRLNGSNLTAGQSFTQQDIALGRVSYRHNGSETISDSFNFVVSDGAGGNIGSTTFNLNIIPVDDPPQTLSNGPLTIAEGAVTTITRSLLLTTDPESQPITYRLLASPLRGSLIRDNNTTLGVTDTFTQAEIDSGRIAYANNGSEQVTDAFFYSVTDGTTTFNQIFNINVTPVNDAPQFLTPNPTITVAGDVPSETEISAGLLFTTDVDNTPNQITYRLTTAPNSTFGQLVLNGSTLLSGQTFTQADIDAGRLVYRSVGGGSTDTFQFDITDGGVGGTLPVQFFTIIFAYPDGS